MRKKRLVNVLTSAALTAALVMSMGITAMADENTGVNGGGTAETAVGSITITKTVTTDANTYQPNTSFEFEVDEGTATTYDDQSVTAGIKGGLSISKSNDRTDAADFTYKNADGLDASTNEYVNKDVSIIVNDDAFTNATPGIYHYVVYEKSSATTDGTYTDYSGVTYDETLYDVYVYVLNDGESNYVGYVVVMKDGTKSDLSFTNDYGAEQDTTHDLKITKELDGDLQNASDDFKVTVAVSDGGSGQAYKVVVMNKDSETDYSVIGEGDEVEVIINKDSTITIYGLTDDATVTVKETDTNGYTATYTTTSSDLTANGNVLSGKVKDDGTTATLTNKKEAVTPTGIILNFAPYILLVAFAGVFAVLFLGKRKEEV